ncbi:Gfo/Idh/MocA family protein [Planctomicrobium sp. SH668]|uniref:Gfo/Idh/MocA family protein n=1 Tax=Planctomicrobium sp. SH668 TaxID=3448126 RepID=UPI003F5AF45C
MTQNFSRRGFLKTAAVASAATALPLSASIAQAAEQGKKFRTAHIGVGGMQGLSDLMAIKSHPNVEVVALCDIDSTFLENAAKELPNAKKYRDYRQMFEEMADEIDGVVISTPDHMHAPPAMAAMNHNKPVYCQKPLTHEIYESRRLREVAEEKGLVTQMGTQIHSSREYRQAKAIVQSGAIGKVSKVIAWKTGGWNYDGGPFEDFAEVPPNVEWDLWLGVTADRKYVPKVYHPIEWRRLIDFGTGTLGDMGVHIFDTPFGSLELTAPNWVKTECREPNGLGHPSMSVTYEFPGTKYTTDTLEWVWKDGDYAPRKGEEVGLPEGLELPGAASLFIGEKGMLLLQHIAEAKLFPEEKFKDYKKPDVEGGNHYHLWVDAAMNNTKTTCSFSYGGPLTEALLLGVVGSRFPGEVLKWDSKKLEVTNKPEANQYIRREYRDAFKTENLS